MSTNRMAGFAYGSKCPNREEVVWPRVPDSIFSTSSGRMDMRI